MSVLRLPWVDPKAIGVDRVPIQELRTKLGKPAWSVWRALCQVRSYGGEVHITRRGLARMTNLSDHTVKDALKRLTCAGLVAGRGWHERRVMRGKCEVTAKVYVRDVFGAITLSEIPTIQRYEDIETFWDTFVQPRDAVVPSTTFMWLSSASTWGGSRAGSGQNRRTTTGEMWRTTTVSVSSTPNPLVSSTPTDKDYKQSNTLERSSSNEEEDGAETTPHFSLPSKLGIVIGGGAKPRCRLVDPTSWSCVPPYPGIALVGLAQTPPPPKMTEGMSARERCETIAAAWRGAIKKRTGDRSFSFIKGDILKTKWTKLLLSSAQLFIDHAIPPTSWALFSLDIWRENNSKPIPPLGWAFGPRRIVERRGWFRRCAQSYGGGRLMFGPRNKDLIDRYSRMVNDIHRRMTDNESEIEVIVAKHFPLDHSFAYCLSAARDEADRYRFDFAQKVLRGEFLWG